MTRDLEAPRCAGYYSLAGQASITSAAGRFGGVEQREVKVTASADGAERPEADPPNSIAGMDVGSTAEPIAGGSAELRRYRRHGYGAYPLHLARRS